MSEGIPGFSLLFWHNYHNLLFVSQKGHGLEDALYGYPKLTNIPGDSEVIGP